MPRLPARGYRVAIPSYQRPEILTTHTIPLLLNGGIDPDRITVFLHDDDPRRAEYARRLATLGVHHESTIARGIAQQRAHIAQHYPAGTPVLCCDDDITRILRAEDTKNLHDVTDLETWAHAAFLSTAAADLHVFGVSPVVNPFFMRPGRPPSTGLKFCIGTLFGFFSRPGHPVHETTVPVKEDYELSLRVWWHDGGILRFDDHTVQADHYRLAGGCQPGRDTHASEHAAEALCAAWPGLVRRNPKRSGEHAEILLASRPRHAGKALA